MKFSTGIFPPFRTKHLNIERERESFGWLEARTFYTPFKSIRVLRWSSWEVLRFRLSSQLFLSISFACRKWLYPGSEFNLEWKYRCKLWIHAICCSCCWCWCWCTLQNVNELAEMTKGREKRARARDIIMLKWKSVYLNCVRNECAYVLRHSLNNEQQYLHKLQRVRGHHMSL